MLEAGAKVPDLTVQDDQGNEVRLRDLEGTSYILYFYPKDDTLG